MKCWQDVRKVLSSPHQHMHPLTMEVSVTQDSAPWGSVGGSVTLPPPLRYGGFEENSPDPNRGEVNGGITGRGMDPIFVFRYTKDSGVGERSPYRGVS